MAERGERLIWRVGDLLTERAAEFGQLEALDNGKSAATAARRARHSVGSRRIPVLRGLGHLRSRQHQQRLDAVRAGRRVPRLHAPRAGRGLRADRAVELPAAHGPVEASRPPSQPATR